MVLTSYFFAITAKYEANFFVLFLLLLEMIWALKLLSHPVNDQRYWYFLQVQFLTETFILAIINNNTVFCDCTGTHFRDLSQHLVSSRHVCWLPNVTRGWIHIVWTTSTTVASVHWYSHNVIIMLNEHWQTWFCKRVSFLDFTDLWLT